MPPPSDLFFERMAQLLGPQELAAFRAVYDRPPVAGLRLNTLKTPLPETQSLWEGGRPVPWCPAGLSFDGEAVDERESRPGKHPWHAAGLYYLQDPSAMAVAEIAAPRPGERVLDLAAAPGGKATHLASLMQNQGLLIANEIHPKRVWDLAENLERWGATNATITNDTPEKLAARLASFFDLVVVDAPCSGEGMFRKSAAARAEWDEALVLGCATRQDGILAAAAALVRPGGRLVYSTCTFAPEENEGTVGRFLDQHPEFSTTPISLREFFAPGRPEWAGYTPAADPPTRHAVRLWPHLLTGEGHFVALLHKHAGEMEGAAPRPFAQNRPDRTQLRWLDQFAEETVRVRPWDETALHVYHDQLFALPPDLPDLRGVRLIRPGWWLGSFKKNRFEPGHALALAIDPAQVAQQVALTADDPQTAAYLRGEILEAAGPNGWALVTVDRFGLGWGKRVNGRVKNHYPKGLRQPLR